MMHSSELIAACFRSSAAGSGLSEKEASELADLAVRTLCMAKLIPMPRLESFERAAAIYHLSGQIRQVDLATRFALHPAAVCRIIRGHLEVRRQIFERAG